MGDQVSINQQVRELFSPHIGEKFDNAMLRQALETDEAQAISVALNVMHTNGEISREKRPAGPGYLYWMGVASTSEVRTIKGSATVDDDEPPPEKADVKPTTEKQKRRYTKRAPPRSASRYNRHSLASVDTSPTAHGPKYSHCTLRNSRRWHGRYCAWKRVSEFAGRRSAKAAELSQNSRAALELRP